MFFLDVPDVFFLFLRSDKEVSDENMGSEIDEKMVSETLKEGVVSEIVKEDLGNVDEILRLVFLLLWAAIM